MAKIRKAKQTDLVSRANRASASEAASFVEEFDRLERDREDKLRDLDNDFKSKKRAINTQVNEDQKSILVDAKKVGVDKGIIRGLADPNKRKRKAQRELERANQKAENAIDALEAEKRDYAIDIRAALGEDFASFGLGAAAVERDEDDADDKPDAAATAAGKAWGAEDGAGAPTH